MNGGPKALRELISRPGIVRGLGAHDAFSAMIAARAGFEIVFLGGFGASGSLLGLPDLNFITATEMADLTRRVAARVDCPVIADGDTGHGDLHQVQRTVELFEAAGAAGMLLEDQVAPKRCGHFAGKDVIASGEMVLKIRAAVAARRDPNFVIIARTDARAPLGFDEAVERVNHYCDAGAGVAFIEAPQTREELEDAAKRVKYPLFANMVSGGATPILSAAELAEIGYKIVAWPVESLMVCARALENLCTEIMKTGRADTMALEAMSFGDLKERLGVGKFLDLRRELEEGGDEKQ